MSKNLKKCNNCERTENLKYVRHSNGGVFLCFAHYGWYNQIKTNKTKVIKYLKLNEKNNK